MRLEWSPANDGAYYAWDPAALYLYVLYPERAGLTPWGHYTAAEWRFLARNAYCEPPYRWAVLAVEVGL